MKKKMKVLLNILIYICLTAMVIVGYYFACMDPCRGGIDNYEVTRPLTDTLTKEEALEDLEYVYTKISEHHPAWIDGNDTLVDAFRNQYQVEKELLIKEENPTVLTVWKSCARLTNVMRDGHTQVFYNTWDSRFINDLTQMSIYGLPTKIDGIPLSEVEKTFLSIYSYEREEYAQYQFYSSLICMDSWLAVSGIDITDGVVFTYDTNEGEKDFTYWFVPYEQVKLSDSSNDIEGSRKATTEKEKEGNNQASDIIVRKDCDWVYYELDLDNSTAIFTLTTCNNNDTYKNCVDELFREVKENNIQNVIVDLRGNGGGNSSVADYFLGYLDTEEIEGWDFAVRCGWFLYKNTGYRVKCPKLENDFSGNLYVLTDINSFSSAMDFAMLVTDNHLGTLIGEASGNMPDGYGDHVGFQTKNSKLCIGISIKKWWRIDLSKCGQPITPDYEVRGRDALDKAYELIMER